MIQEKLQTLCAERYSEVSENLEKSHCEKSLVDGCVKLCTISCSVDTVEWVTLSLSDVEKHCLSGT